MESLILRSIHRLVDIELLQRCNGRREFQNVCAQKVTAIINTKTVNVQRQAASTCCHISNLEKKKLSASLEQVDIRILAILQTMG